MCKAIDMKEFLTSAKHSLRYTVLVMLNKLYAMYYFTVTYIKTQVICKWLTAIPGNS